MIFKLNLSIEFFFHDQRHLGYSFTSSHLKVNIWSRFLRSLGEIKFNLTPKSRHFLLLLSLNKLKLLNKEIFSLTFLLLQLVLFNYWRKLNIVAKGEILIMNNFIFCHNVFKSCQGASKWRKGLRQMFSNYVKWDNLLNSQIIEIPFNSKVLCAQQLCGVLTVSNPR